LLELQLISSAATAIVGEANILLLADQELPVQYQVLPALVNVCPVAGLEGKLIAIVIP
jgi:hypothetical protein